MDLLFQTYISNKDISF